MKKIIVAALALFCGFALHAQNNPYEIDDACYRHFANSDLTLGTAEYRAHADSLLDRALAVGDKKAEVLYYVQELKDITRRLAAVENPTTADNMAVEEAKDMVLRLSEKYDYMQYYYYALEILQNYYYNHGQKSVAMRLAEDAHEYATRKHDEFGVWYTSKYLIALYREREDYITTRTYIKQALEQHERSNDRNIRRQSPCRLYCDLSDTYPVGSDSMYLYIHKAEKSATTRLDSARVRFYLAVEHALKREEAEYKALEEQCLGDKAFYRMRVAHPIFFDSVDKLMAGQDVDPKMVVDTLVTSRNVKFLANIAEVYGNGRLAFDLEKQLVTRLEKNLSKVGLANLAEMNARLGNTTLSENLLSKERDLARTTTMVFILIAVLLLALLLFVLGRLASLRRSKKKDEAMIAKLREANETVRLANEAKTRFVQNMSHEVRTPLNAIVGFSQLLSLPDGAFSNEEKEEFSKHIINNTRMLNMLLDDILNASSMDKGKYTITLEQGEVKAMCEAAISSAEHRLQPGVTMQFKPESEGEYWFRTDPGRVQQILVNFLTNACKHTQQGTITLTTSTMARPGFMTFAVEDTGCGVPADQAEAIFDRFTKLNEYAQGTGLGLSICREIADRMGGRVWLDTSYTGGARFVFEVPLDPTPAA